MPNAYPTHTYVAAPHHHQHHTHTHTHALKYTNNVYSAGMHGSALWGTFTWGHSCTCPRPHNASTRAHAGKTKCSRCMGSTGFYCRACLLVRYGRELEEVRTEMAAGTWLCPHCYEEEHPDEVGVQ
jgi:hypothetical protein